MNYKSLLVAAALGISALSLAGCVSETSSYSGGGGYYNDGPDYYAVEGRSYRYRPAPYVVRRDEYRIDRRYDRRADYNRRDDGWQRDRPRDYRRDDPRFDRPRDNRPIARVDRDNDGGRVVRPRDERPVVRPDRNNDGSRVTRQRCKLPDCSDQMPPRQSQRG